MVADQTGHLVSEHLVKSIRLKQLLRDGCFYNNHGNYVLMTGMQVMQAVDNDLISFVSKFNIDEILSMNIYIPHHSVTFLLYHFFYSVKRSASEISFGNHLRYVSQVNKRLQELLF